MSWWSNISSGVGNYFNSGSGWGDLFQGILGGLGGVSQGKSDKKAAKIAGEYSLRGIRETGRESRRSSEYETLLNKWVKDKEKEERRLGLSNFAKFSKQNYGPNVYTRPAVGNMPTADGYQSGLSTYQIQSQEPPKPPKG